MLKMGRTVKSAGHAPRRKKAPVRLTGNTGTRYENLVAARLLLDMLAGLNSLGPDFGRITRVDWQARDAGWLADDLALTCEGPADDRRSVGISIKSNQQLSARGFPSDFVDLAWGQWLGRGTARVFQRGRDAITVVVAELPSAVKSDWTALLSEILQSTAERVVARLSSSNTKDGSQASALQRSIVTGFACPERYEHPVDMTETVRLLHDVRVLDFDFNSPTSQSRGHALHDCQSILTSGDAGEAQDLWNRLLGIADEKRPAGGSLDLRELLAALRDRFNFRDHPDFRADWDTLLRRSRDTIAEIETRIAGLAHLSRSDDRVAITGRLQSAGICILVGESGSGKSALAKEIVLTDYPRTIWLSAHRLDHDSPLDFERAVGLHYPLVDLLRAAPTRSLVVFDGVEAYSERALRLTARIAGELLSSQATHVHLLFSLQFQSADSKMRQLARLGVPQASLEPTLIGRPDADEIQELLSPFPDLLWLALRPQLRPLLTNLKVLDWFARSPSQSAGEDDQFFGLAAVIDQLWGQWTESSADGLARSHLLMKLATTEAETLSRGVPRTQLGSGEQKTLPGLEQSGLIHIHDERVSLAHDLLGDWARLRVLVAEDATSTSTESRAGSPRWQQAVRLFGQRLLELSADGEARWRRSVENVNDESVSAGLLRDLFLDALFQATNATELLNRTWTTLTAGTGALLNRLLDRFLFVASLPDPRLAVLSADQEEATRLEHLLRVPFWPYWGPLLTVLHARRDDVVRLAPYTAAKICALWLSTTPDELGSGRPMPWREHAAELALAIAREIQARNAEGYYYSAGSDRVVYEAGLYAASASPVEVAALCLELAARKDMSPVIADRVADARRNGSRERARQDAENGQRRKAPVMIGMPRGRLRPPWPDGPRGKVDRAFREACLGGAPVMALVKANPDAALEVLLAVSIEEPKHDEFVRSSLPECGLSYWPEGDPAAYFRGPFLQFFRLAPNQALSFVIRLTNFGTHRYTEDRVWLDITVDGELKHWYGDSNVFRWHHDWPLSHGSQIQSGLMALEQWLYEQIDKGISIEPWITRIITESESLAFAGVLFDVGKRAPDLFCTVLAPLFFTWEIWNWDFQLATLRQSERQPSGYWGGQARSLIRLAQEWHQLPHRSEALLTANGLIPRTMLGHRQYRAFFDEVRSAWKAALQQDGEPEHLRLLVERLDPGNYTFEQRGNEIVPVNFAWPEAIAQQNEKDLQALADRQTISQLPWRCRKFLDAGAPLPGDQLRWLWDFLQALDAEPPELPSDSSGPLLRMEDVFCGGIALLLSTSRDWLLQDTSRMAWCRRKLQATIDDPPPPRRFDSELSIGNERWDCFAAECGVLLLAADPTDVLARQLVGAGLVAFNYNTTALTMTRAAAAREKLGDAFAQMVAMAVQWAALRPLQVRHGTPALETEREAFVARKGALLDAFANGSLSPVAADLRKINAETRVAHDAIYEKQFPGSSVRTERHQKSPGRRQTREVLHADSLGLDPYAMKSAFAWLDVRVARTPGERLAWLGLIQEILAIVLETVPVVKAGATQEVDGLPSDFDGWAFKLVARTIPCLGPPESPDSFWRPILDRGAPAHEWVERFFWYWFTDGFAASPSPSDFVRIWRAMITHALEHAAWDPASTISFELDDMVLELLCFDVRWNAIVRSDDNAQVIGTLEDVFERALERWGGMPKVISGLVMFAIQPGAKELLVPALWWTSAAVRRFDSYDWKYGVEENVIEFLHACWQREGARIAQDELLRASFIAVLTILVSRGSHAAIALNSRVVGSIAS
jgi:hypothetical protein